VASSQVKILNRTKPCTCGCQGGDSWHARRFSRVVREGREGRWTVNSSPFGKGIAVEVGRARFPWGDAAVARVVVTHLVLSYDDEGGIEGASAEPVIRQDGTEALHGWVILEDEPVEIRPEDDPGREAREAVQVKATQAKAEKTEAREARGTVHQEQRDRGLAEFEVELAEIRRLRLEALEAKGEAALVRDRVRRERAERTTTEENRARTIFADDSLEAEEAKTRCCMQQRANYQVKIQEERDAEAEDLCPTGPGQTHTVDSDGICVWCGADRAETPEDKPDPSGEPHSEQRRVVVDDLLVALRGLGWRVGTRTDLEAWPVEQLDLFLRVVLDREAAVRF